LARRHTEKLPISEELTRHLENVCLVIERMTNQDEIDAARLFTVLRVLPANLIEALGLLETATFYVMEHSKFARRVSDSAMSSTGSFSI